MAFVGAVEYLFGADFRPGERLLDDPGISDVKLSLIGAVLYIGFAWMLLEIRSVKPKGMIFIGFAAFACLPLASIFWIPALNSWLDFSPETSHTVRIQGKKVYRVLAFGVRVKEVVVLQSWRDQRRPEISISTSDYARVMPRQTMITITTKPGLFGFDWVAEYRINPGPMKVNPER
jgi:hypothetical protein